MISFLQSSEWEEFQRSLGRKIWRVDGRLIVQHKFFFDFNYLYSPRPRIENADTFFFKAREIAQKEKAIFLKIDPSENFQFSKFASSANSGASPVGSKDICFRLNFQFSNTIQPQKTLILDLFKSEEELLAAMRVKTRYNIRLAERRGVTVHQSNDFRMFWNLLQETAERDGFHTHERSYYEKLLAVKSADFSNQLFFAEYRGKVLAAALVNFYGGSTSIDGAATYLHGASGREYREVMAPHLLHWGIIKEARRRGFRHYDFWGIDEKRWHGVTRFKKGFGGEIVQYPAAIDCVYKPVWYALYQLARKTA